MSEFVPANALEKSLAEVKSGKLEMGPFIAILLDSELAVPSSTEMKADGAGFTPLFFDKAGTHMMAAFTDKSRQAQFAHVAPYTLTMRGRDLLKRLPPGYGLVFNPGTQTGFDLPPQGIAGIIKDFHL